MLTFTVKMQKDGGYESNHFFNPDHITKVFTKTFEELLTEIANEMREYFTKTESEFAINMELKTNEC